MNRLIILFAIMIFPLIATGQIRIGLTEYEIRQEFKENEILTSYESHNGRRFISVQFDTWMCAYYFDEKLICDRMIIVPFTDKTLHGFIEFYNKNYVIVDDDTWKKYDKNGIVVIELAYNEEMSNFSFVMFLAKK
jgi:hypothetical protein